MATTINLLQHPTHDHPLVPRDFTNDSIEPPSCRLCERKIWAGAYTCQEKCKSYYYHRVCAEAPPQIYPHPLHSHHPLTLIHGRRIFQCDACGELCYLHRNSFTCVQCNFNLDMCCALSTLSDLRGSPGGTTPEQIDLPLHPHTLTSFLMRHDFVRHGDCVICKASVEGDGYTCLHSQCKFLIHKACIQDMCYTDGTKAPQIYHRHPLKIFLGEDMGSTRCARCGSNTSSGEFIGCAGCEVFIHRDCIQVPEVLQYPPHPDHTLVLLINHPDNQGLRCGSCLVSMEGELCYGCPSCEFLAHVGCALQVLTYCEEGMSAEIKLSWHEHPLLLCHNWKHCSFCEDESDGPMYACKEKDCIPFMLHKRCTEIKSTIIHPHHPDHPLTLHQGADIHSCEACWETILRIYFSCELCSVYLHTRCATHFPTRKHYLHEHELLYLDNAPSLECNCCGTSTDFPVLRCVPCNFNLHEACMELPRVVKSEIHWHSLTLHENYVDDDSGEYYCDKCEKRRDGQLGAYVCLQCSARWVYHIECVLPELGKVYAKKIQTSVFKRMAEKIAIKSGQVSAAEEKLEEAKREFDELKRELDELMKENEELISKGGDPEKPV